MRRLIINQIDETFDPTTDVAIAPRCFLDREGVYPEWDELPFVNPLATPQQQFEESEKLRLLALEFLGAYAVKMNAMHDRTYSYGYWRILLLPWLINMLMVVRKRYLEIQTLARRHPDENFDVLIANTGVTWQFVDDTDMWRRGFRHPLFDYWLSSLMCEALAPPSWNLTKSDISCPLIEPDVSHHEPIPNLPRRLRRLVIGRSHLRAVPGVNFWLETTLSLCISAMELFRTKDADSLIASRPVEDTQHGYSAHFRAAAEKVLNATFPRSYDVDFVDNEAAARKRKYKNGRLMVTPGGPLHHTVWGKFEAAHAYEAGEKLVCVQHGTGPGLAKNFMLFSEIEYQLHGFISWGWSAHLPYTDRAVPLPSPLLSKLVKRRRKSTDSLVLVGTEIPAGANRLNSEPEGPGFLAYRRMKRDFIWGLDGAPRGLIRYRPYPSGRGTFEDMKYIKRTAGDVPEVVGDLLPQLFASKLVVLDYPGTPLAYAMASNTPIICLWDADGWPWTSDGDRFLGKMRAAGIYHSSPLTAADFVNSNWSDIEGWWATPAVQDIRREWLEQHGLTSTSWFWHWLRGLWALNRAPRRVVKDPVSARKQGVPA